ncbi:MAG: hypothetical protein ABFD54_14670 [Armatimonadota bacterium]|nr:hypothetical protein [bacterium]
MKNKVTRNYYIAFALVMAAAIQTGCAAQDNLLDSYNPGFEVTGSGIPSWSKSYGTASVVSDTYHTGSRSLLCGNSTKIYSSNTITVEPGYAYCISAWGKFNNLKFISNGLYGAGFGLEQRNANNVINGNWYDMQTYIKYAEGNSDWVYAERRWTPKETTTTLRPFILIQADAGSQVWFDDIRVWKEPLPDRTLQILANVTENGSFEIRDASGMHANGFAIKAPEGMYDTYNSHASCVTDVKRQGAVSMMMNGECTLTSNKGYLNTNQANAKISIKTVGITGDGAYARLVFYSMSGAVIGIRDVAALAGTSDWQVFNVDLNTTRIETRYAQWEFGMKPGSAGTVYFDDLQVNTPSVYQAMPIRSKDTAQAAVTVDCTARMQTFNSPLNAFDTGGFWYAYSPTIGTAGKWVEGPGRWYTQRTQLGFKYVRLHDVYGTHVYAMNSDGNGKWLLSTGQSRTKYPESSEAFPTFYTIYSNGVPHYDFSGIKQVIDKAVLQSGCKPILGFWPVPMMLAKNYDWRYIPRDQNCWNLWEELNYQFVKYLVDTYGKDEILTWIFETGNEPSSGATFWGDPDNPDNMMNDFFKLQDYSIHGARRALPEIFISGPSGPPDTWMEPMLTHCATGVNYYTGQVGTQIDAMSYHGYMGGSSLDISWRPSEDQILKYQGYLDSYYQKTGKRLPLFNTEFAPIHSDGYTNLNNIPHENDNHIQAIATMHAANFSYRLGVNLLIFFLEAPNATVYYDGVPMTDVPEFTGQSTCVTFHGIFTPLSRASQMMSMLNGGNLVNASADKEPIYTLATATDTKINVLCYSFDQNPAASYTTSVAVSVNPAGIGSSFRVQRYVLSSTQANSWYLANQRSLTQADCARDSSLIDSINNASKLVPIDDGVKTVTDGAIHLNVSIPAYSALLFVLEKAD